MCALETRVYMTNLTRTIQVMLVALVQFMYLIATFFPIFDENSLIPINKCLQDAE